MFDTFPHSEIFGNIFVPRLFQTTQTEIAKMWKARNHKHLTLGYDSFKLGANVHILNMTESARDKYDFKACVQPGINRENAEFYGDQINLVMPSTARDLGKTVEDVYICFFSDNVSYNRASFAILHAKYS